MTDKHHESHGETHHESHHETRTPWQRALLPLMIGAIVVAAVAFGVIGFMQIRNLETQIVAKAPELDQLAKSSDARVVLEAVVVRNRYHQANALLLSRCTMAYLGFLTGMLLALVGATFILGKLREHTSEVGAKTGGVDLSLKSSSPGLILSVLGVALMAVTTITHQPIVVADAPVYLAGASPRARAHGDATQAPTTMTSPPVAPTASDVNDLAKELEGITGTLGVPPGGSDPLGGGDKGAHP